MRLGWISFKEEIPPLGLEVGILYPNRAYGGHCFFGETAVRIDDNNMAITGSYHNIKVPIKPNENEQGWRSTALYWCYNVVQELPKICECFGCEKDKKIKRLHTELKR